MITKIRTLIARVLALSILLCTFGLLRVHWSGGTVEQAREREGRASVMILDVVDPKPIDAGPAPRSGTPRPIA